MAAKFTRKMNAALEQVQTVLSNEKRPRPAASVQHSYADKFSLAESIVSTSIAATFTCFEAMGLEREAMETARRLAERQTITLISTGDVKCTFNRKTVREDVKSEHSTTFIGSVAAKIIGKRIEKITEYFWDVEFTGKLELVAGPLASNDSERILLRSWLGRAEEITRVEDSPRPKVQLVDPLSVDVTWFFNQIQESHKVNFMIDREKESCKTPRRNEAVDAACKALLSLNAWLVSAKRAFNRDEQFRTDIDTSSFLEQDAILIPVIPLFEDMSDEQFPVEEAKDNPPPAEEPSIDGEVATSLDLLSVDSSAMKEDSSQRSRSKSPGRRRSFFGRSKSREAKSPREGKSSREAKSPRERKSPRDEARRDGRSPRKDPVVENTDESKSPRKQSSAKEKKASINRMGLQHGDILVEYGYQRKDAPLLSSKYVNKFLREHKRGLVRNARIVIKTVPAVKSHLIVPECLVWTAATQLNLLVSCTLDALKYVEAMLYEQFEAAIGKVITEKDFLEFVVFSQRKLFREEYAPLPFSHSICRPNHNPEGVVSIEHRGLNGDTGGEAITTFTSQAKATHAMHMPIAAGTSLPFFGERTVHAHVMFQFNSQSGGNLSLRARARQFSCFVIVIGKIVSAAVFEPTAALLVKNKDEVEFVLQLATVPSPKKFRDSTASLSPEQRAFAQSFRAMQLEGTLFSLLLVDVKPQLEKVLNLPEDSLTKEIGLTQDLLDLLSVYQIPTSMLSFDPTNDIASPDLQLSSGEMVAVVMRNVEAMKQMITGVQNKSLEDRRMERKARSVQALGEGDIAVSEGSAHSYGPGSNRPSVDSMSPAARLDEGALSSAQVAEDNGEDFTQLPKQLDRSYDKLDEDCRMRPVVLSLAPKRWERARFASLLTEKQTTSLSKDDMADERSSAFDLLDALTRSGSLPMDYAHLHVVLASSYSFSRSLIDTILKDNINPIEKLERAMLIMATTVLKKKAEDLVLPSRAAELAQRSPALFQSCSK